MEPDLAGFKDWCHHLLAVFIFVKVFNHSELQFPHLKNRDNNIYLIRFLWELSNLIYVKNTKHYLAHTKRSEVQNALFSSFANKSISEYMFSSGYTSVMSQLMWRILLMVLYMSIFMLALFPYLAQSSLGIMFNNFNYSILKHFCV